MGTKKGRESAKEKTNNIKSTVIDINAAGKFDYAPIIINVIGDKLGLNDKRKYLTMVKIVRFHKH
jgi:hypothetical protein